MFFKEYSYTLLLLLVSLLLLLLLLLIMWLLFDSDDFYFLQAMEFAEKMFQCHYEQLSKETDQYLEEWFKVRDQQTKQ